MGSITGVIKGNTRSLDYSSCGFKPFGFDFFGLAGLMLQSLAYWPAPKANWYRLNVSPQRKGCCHDDLGFANACPQTCQKTLLR